jgi:hypothetical protein
VSPSSLPQAVTPSSPCAHAPCAWDIARARALQSRARARPSFLRTSDNALAPPTLALLHCRRSPRPTPTPSPQGRGERCRTGFDPDEASLAPALPPCRHASPTTSRVCACPPQRCLKCYTLEFFNVPHSFDCMTFCGVETFRTLNTGCSVSLLDLKQRARNHPRYCSPICTSSVVIRHAYSPPT